MRLRFVDGRPVSHVTTAFLEWLCQQLQSRGQRELVLIWDNASWHVSQFRLMSANAFSSLNDIPVLHARLFEEGIEAASEFGEVVAGHLGIQVVFQVIGEFQEEGGNDCAP